MIEEALYRHLQQCEELRPFLATYGGKMAIFNQEAPPDTDAGWGEGSQYARIVFMEDTMSDPDRRVSGTLIVDVICEKGKQYPEDILPIIKPLIDGYFFTDADKDMTVSAHWSASDLFTTPPENKINGVTITFNLLFYPKQTTQDPDPIEAINLWSSGELQELLGHELYVIGDDTLPAVFRPTGEKPAIYWRVSGIGPCNWISDTWAACWQTATLQGYIIAPNHGDTEIKIARVIVNTLTNKKRLRTAESVFMVDRTNSISTTSGSQRNGQVSIEATYGVPNIPPESEKMMHITVTDIWKGD